jgi:hypothetical protein
MAVNRDYNPFANQDVHVSTAFQEHLRRFSRTQGADDPGKQTPEDTPFNRYIDFWVLGAALGAAEGMFVPLDASDRHRFITGQVLQGDLDRIQLLMMIAIAHEGDPFVVAEPRKVLDIAEGYASGGITALLEMLEDGHLRSLQNLTRGLVRKLSSGATVELAL